MRCQSSTRMPQASTNLSSDPESISALCLMRCSPRSAKRVSSTAEDDGEGVVLLTVPFCNNRQLPAMYKPVYLDNRSSSMSW